MPLKAIFFLLLFAFNVKAQDCSTCGCYHHSEAEPHAASIVVATIDGCHCAPRANSSFLETSFSLDVESVEKGQAPATAHCPGGATGGLQIVDSRSFSLTPGKRYRLFLDPEENILAAQALDPDQGESGGTGSTTPSGYLEGSSGVPARFVVADQGRPIHYLVDTDALPLGITQEQAIQAVADALAAWSNATELNFIFDGVSSFGVAAEDVVHNDDERLYIQLHDLYNAISSSSTLGIGGRGATIPGYIPGGGGGSGGTLGGTAFHQTTYGYVVMHHTSSSNENLETFAEVLTHEIGHALGLAHSSENPSEPDPIKADAIMYYQAHGGGRGATLGTYDTDCIRFGYPNNGFVPFSVNRTMYGTGTTPTPGISQFSLLPHDLDDLASNLTIILESSTSSNGVFTLSGNTISIAMNFNFGPFSLSEAQILGTTSYDQAVFRIYDGTHYSPYYQVRLIGNKTSSGPEQLAEPDLTSSQDFDVSWDCELFRTYEVQTSQDGTNWQTNQLWWARANSFTTSSFMTEDFSNRLVRVIVWP